MKKIFTLIAMAFLGMGGATAQNDGVVELSWATMVKDADGLNAADQTNTEFYSDVENQIKSGFILTRADGSARTQAQTDRQDCIGMALNFQNAKAQKLVIPEGTKVYKINFNGWAQGDNWSYLYAYGPSDTQWEWTDPIGEGVTDNKTIIEQAKYPLDPCEVVPENAKDGYSPVYHQAGYCFASIDFSDEPYEGEFCFVFNGNNQERAWITIYTTPEAAAAAPEAEPVIQTQPQPADPNAIELSWATMVKDEEGLNAADQTNTEFFSDVENQVKSGFILTRADGSARTQAQTDRQDCIGMALNFQNAKAQKLIIPEGTKVYKINFNGWAQGDNWSYLYAYGPSDTQWEWTDPIGEGVTDNKTIIEQAKYPLDPCEVVPENAKDGYSPVYHQAGYCFASIDFSDEPYEGEFCFVFNGNNQERAWITVYTSLEAAAAAPSAEPATGTTSIGNIPVVNTKGNNAVYNIAGQRVDNNYKGLVIKNGKKCLVK